MKKIKINGTEYALKYTIRALFIFEQITGKSFRIETVLDNYIFFYSIILANNPDKVLQWDDYLDALDNDPSLFERISEAVATLAKVEDVAAITDEKKTANKSA